MEIVSEFFVPLSPEEAWNTLLDFGRVAQAMPGARLDEAEGDFVKGAVTVRLGPMRIEYHGTARVDASDPQRRELEIEARGDETRGTGSASARIRTRLSPMESGTTVEIRADLDVTGRPAQMGAGLIQDVAKRLTDEFAERLRRDLAGEAQPAVASGPDPDPTAELDLAQLIGRPLLQRVAGGILVLVVVWLVWRAWR